MFKLAPRGHDEKPFQTEWIGTLSNAASATDVAEGTFGANVVNAVGPHPALVWSFVSGGGVRELWTSYASWESRPTRIYVNGDLVAGFGMWEPTGGWGERDQTAGFQALVSLHAGENEIRVEGAPSFPHLRNLSICIPTGAKPSADERHAQSERIAQANDAARIELHSGTFDQINQFVAQVRRGGLTSSKIKQVVVDYLDAHARIQSNMDILNGFGGPFNGQRLRLRIANDLMEVVNFSAFIETGSYFGTTTEHFARTGIPVLSCEAMIENFVVAAARLSRYRNVDLQLDDSRSFLRNTFSQNTELYKCPLFYLDAHWYDDLPLPEELNFISENVKGYVAIVDDFEVPGSEYFYDTYSNGNELTFKFLVPKLERLDSIVLLVPANASTEETGPRKGTLFVCPKSMYDDKIKYVSRLKVVDPTPWL